MSELPELPVRPVRERGESLNDFMVRLSEWTMAHAAYRRAYKQAGVPVPEPPPKPAQPPPSPAADRAPPPVARHTGPGYWGRGIPVNDGFRMTKGDVGNRKVNIVTGLFTGQEIDVPKYSDVPLSVIEGQVECAGPGLALIRRMGGKQRLLPWLLQQFPRNVGCYVEPFGGSFKVLLGKPWRDRIEVINDLDGDIVHFYQWVQRNPEALADYINTAFPFAHEAIIIGLRGELMDKRLTGIERAAAFYVCSRSAFNGKIMKANGAYASSPFAPISIKASRERFMSCFERLRGVDIRSTSYERVLDAMVKRLPSGLFVYMDPPYWQTAGYEGYGDLKTDGFTWNHHVKLFEYCCEIDRVGGRFIQTNSDHEDLRQLYGSNKRFYIQRRMVKYMISANVAARRDTGEFIISNYPLSTLGLPEEELAMEED